MPNEKILVTGATGKLSRHVVRQLLAEGAEVKAGTRSPQNAAELFGGQVEVVELDYDRTDTFDDALTWADRVFVMPPPFRPDVLEAMAPFLDWAVSMKVEHVVLVSGMGVDRDPDLALRRLERHVEAQDNRHTILRPNLYMQNFHPGFLAREIRDEGRFRLPAGSGRVSLVDVRDVAAVAVRALTTRTFLDRVCVLTGAESLTLEEVAAAISRARGGAVRYEPLDDESFRRLLAERGWKEGEVEVILGLFNSIREGRRAPVHPDVSEILGRPPLSFEAFCRESAPFWG